MGTTVQETKIVNYSDQSGNFKEGMKKEDVKMSIFEKLLYQTSPSSGFDKLDRDGDGILSHDEITEEIESDIVGNKKIIKSQSLIGLMTTILSYGIRKSSPKISKIGLASGLVSLGMVIWSKIEINKLEKRLANGHN